MTHFNDLKKLMFSAFVLMAGSVLFLSSCSDDEVDPPTAGFTFEVSDLTVTFTSTSTGADTYSWDFGDGNSSTEASPVHVYDAAGTYTVVKTVTNEGGSDSATEQVNVESACESANNSASPNINVTWGDPSEQFDGAFFDGFGNYTTARIENPDQTGNESCYVLQVTRGTGCESWGGVGGGLGGRVDFGTDPAIITLDVWGAATDVTLVFEKDPFPDTDPKVERTVQMTKSDEWETLTFDFSDDAGSGNTYGNLILYITRNQDGCNDEVYYIDNLVQVQ